MCLPAALRRQGRGAQAGRHQLPSPPPIPAPSGVGTDGARPRAAGRDGLRHPAILFLERRPAGGGPARHVVGLNRRAPPRGGARWARACGRELAAARLWVSGEVSG